jgi:DNA-binding GntR family transcriptional regulator
VAEARTQTTDAAASPRGAATIAVPQLFSPLRAATLADRCYQQLKDAIVSLDLRPGTPLSELQVASQLGISKSPVREAFQRLSRDGLVTLEPNRRCVVTGLEIPSIRDWYELRLILEPVSLQGVASQIDQPMLACLKAVNDAAIQACDQLDPLGFIHHSDRFHLALVELNPNRALVEVIRDLFNKIRRVRVALYQQDALGSRRSFTRAGLARHESVIALLGSGAPNDAVVMLRRDIQTFIDELDRGNVTEALERVRFARPQQVPSRVIETKEASPAAPTLES